MEGRRRFHWRAMVLAAGVLLAGFFVFAHASFEREKIQLKSTPREISENLTQALDTLGREEVYRQLKEAYGGSDFRTQHIAAHIFGELLFEREGVDGYAVCDSAYSFGCFHGFSERAIQEKGLGVLTEIDTFCINRYGLSRQDCQHGLGHGILEYFGSNRIVEALDVCRSLTWQEQLFGCVGGVFMEYNFPVLIGEDSAEVSVRPHQNDHPYDPCPTLPENYRPACYYEIPQWWDNVYGKDYQTMGELCHAIRSPEERKSCYRGFGNVLAPSTNYTSEIASRACASLPFDGRSLCATEAALSFLAGGRNVAEALIVCGILEGNAFTECRAIVQEKDHADSLR